MVPALDAGSRGRVNAGLASVRRHLDPVPASRLREVNRVLEDTAWGAYRTEFFPTYDYRAVGLAEHEKAR